MDKLVLLLLFVIFLILLSFIGLWSQVVRYSVSPANFQQISEYSNRRIELPTVERLRSPRAVLVLDVSASMKQNDPDHLETEAAVRFYEVFEGLSKEILARDDSASIAVILFGTIPQVIDWTGARNPWLEVNRSNLELFRSTLSRHLGRKMSEPRLARDTDYLLAINKISEILQGLNSPPLVLFLTDGKCDPHRYFTQPDITGRNKTDLPPAVSAVMSSIDSYSRVAANAQGGGTVFDRSRVQMGSAYGCIPAAGLTGVETAAYRHAVRNAVDRLFSAQVFSLEGRADPVPLMWSPIYFGNDPDSLREARLLLNASKGFWGEGGQTIHCRRAADLVGDFVGVLATWFRLEKRELQSGARSILVPAGTQAFSVFVETDAPVGRVQLVRNGTAIELSGSETVWAGVAAGEGEWSIVAPHGSIARGAIYLRPRYQWVLHAPNRVVPNPSGERKDSIEARLYLYSLENYKPSSPMVLGTRLPDALKGRLTLPNGQTGDFTLQLNRDTKDGNWSGPVYAGQIPIARRTRGNMAVELNLGSLSMLSGDGNQLKRDLNLGSVVQFVLRTEEGTVSGIAVERIPEASAKFSR